MRGEFESGLAVLAAFSSKTWRLFEPFESVQRKDHEDRQRFRQETFWFPQTGAEDEKILAKDQMADHWGATDPTFSGEY